MSEYLDINKKKLDKKDVVRKKAMRFHAIKKRKVIKGITDESESDEIEEENEALAEINEVDHEQDFENIL